jgi:FixJ family two-component response regulator
MDDIVGRLRAFAARDITLMGGARVPFDIDGRPDETGPKRTACEIPSMRPTVFVVDHDAHARRSLELVIGAEGWNVETFPSAFEFLRRADVAGPSCVVLDADLPGTDALEVQRRIAAGRSAMPIIFMAERADLLMTVRAMKQGALDFLPKPPRDEALVAAVREAIERSQAMIQTARELGSARRAYESLSRREREVMGLVVSGLLNKQVARELGICEVTVKCHRGNVMRKMGAPSFADLVKVAGRLGVAAGRRDAIRAA